MLLRSTPLAFRPDSNGSIRRERISTPKQRMHHTDFLRITHLERTTREAPASRNPLCRYLMLCSCTNQDCCDTAMIAGLSRPDGA